MSIMNDLQSRGTIQEYQKGLYYVDVNKNKKLDDNEPKIPVSDKTGKTELKGVLEAIIYKNNDLQIFYETREVIEKNQDEDPAILNVITQEYLPRVKAAEDEELLVKYEFLKKELDQAVKDVESEKAILIRKEMVAIEEMSTIATQVKSLSLSKNTIILNNGNSFSMVDWLDKQGTGWLLHQSVGNAKQDIEVILNNGNKVFCSSLTFLSTNKDKKITAVSVAKDCTVVIGKKPINILKGYTLIINGAGAIEKIGKNGSWDEDLRETTYYYMNLSTGKFDK